MIAVTILFVSVSLIFYREINSGDHKLIYTKPFETTRRERQLTTARAVKIPARNWVDYAVAF